MKWLGAFIGDVHQLELSKGQFCMDFLDFQGVPCYPTSKEFPTRPKTPKIYPNTIYSSTSVAPNHNAPLSIHVEPRSRALTRCSPRLSATGCMAHLSLSRSWLIGRARCLDSIQGWVDYEGCFGNFPVCRINVSFNYFSFIGFYEPLTNSPATKKDLKVKPRWHFGNSSFSRRWFDCLGSSDGAAASFAGDAGAASQSVSDLIVVCRLDCCFPVVVSPEMERKVTVLTRF